jgi:hypothetical protein
MNPPQNLNTKDNLVSLLNGARATFLYGFFIEMLVHKKADVIAEAETGGTFGFQGASERTGLDLGVLAQQLRENEKSIRGNYFLLIEHQAIRVFYELVHSYCQRSGQTAVYAAEPTMQFARVWRNVVAHGDGAVLTQWPAKLKERKITEVAWRSRKICEAQVGTEVSLDIVDIVNLQEDIYAFCLEKLK